jgi:hypothetical protein
MLVRCQHCFQGSCRKHPLQDHGARIEDLKKKMSSLRGNSSSSVDLGSLVDRKSTSQLIKQSIENLKSQSREIDEDNLQAYRDSMEKERRKAEKRRRKVYSEEESKMLADGNRLNPSVLSVMMKNHEHEHEASLGSDSPSSSDREKSKKKRKEERRKKKEEKEKMKSKSHYKKHDRDREES